MNSRTWQPKPGVEVQVSPAFSRRGRTTVVVKGAAADRHRAYVQLRVCERGRWHTWREWAVPGIEVQFLCTVPDEHTEFCFVIRGRVADGFAVTLEGPVTDQGGSSG